jgi:O-antigen biosynthesis protein
VERVLFAPRELPPLPPDVGHQGVYSDWVRLREEERRRTTPRTIETNLALVMVLGDAPPEAVGRTLRSLGAQTSSGWSLTVVSAGPLLREIATVLRSCVSRRDRRRVRTVVGPGGAGPADLLPLGMAAHDNNPVALIFPGDVWAPDATAALGAALPATGVVYADEDRLMMDGTHQMPRLKPDFSPDFLLSSSYIGRPLAIGSVLVRNIPDFDASDNEALEHALALYACEVAEKVIHLPEVLCHRSGDDASSPGMDSLRSVQDVLHRRGDPASVVAGVTPGTFRVRRHAPAETSTSILIPFRDEPQLLRTCVDSVLATTSDHDVEIVLIDNGSSDPETLTLVERLADRPEVVVLRDTRPFNWPQLNNAGTRVARGEVLVFLNNDIEAHATGWLSALIAHALRTDVAAVGARLLYPDRRLQHCGVVVGLTGAAGHPLAGLPEDAVGYLNMAAVTRECSAVTGACLATRREVFENLHGFDETLGIDLNDVDFCLRAGAEGYRTIYEPAAELIHYESPSRGTAGGVGDIVNFIDRWKDYITDGDRYFNRHLTRADPSCGLARPEEVDAWNRWHSILTTP